MKTIALGVLAAAVIAILAGLAIWSAVAEAPWEASSDPVVVEDVADDATDEVRCEAALSLRETLIRQGRFRFDNPDGVRDYDSQQRSAEAEIDAFCGARADDAPTSGLPREIPSDLVVSDTKVGEGTEVAKGATVTIHYTGWLENGSVFDSSVERGEPLTISLANAIYGWQAGVPGMRVGGIRRLVIPPEFAYGAAGTAGIPPNSTLTFEIQLIAIE